MIVETFRKLFQRKKAENTENRAEQTMKKKREELEAAKDQFAETTTDLNKMLDEITDRRNG